MFKGHHFAQVAKAAYLEDTPSRFKELGNTSCKYYDNNGAEAYVAWNSKQITIAFRGTEPTEFSDIKADLNALHFHGYHKGFYTEYLKNADTILEQVFSLLKRKERPVYVCGHSLGGAIATVFSDINDDLVEEVYTYGAPRALTWRRAKEYKVKHIRYRNNNDVVPTVPFWFMGFQHVGECCYINFYGNVRKLTPWQKFKDQWRGRWASLKSGMPFDGIADHNIGDYIRHLEDGK